MIIGTSHRINQPFCKSDLKFGCLQTRWLLQNYEKKKVSLNLRGNLLVDSLGKIAMGQAYTWSTSWSVASSQKYLPQWRFFAYRRVLLDDPNYQLFSQWPNAIKPCWSLKACSMRHKVYNLRWCFVQKKCNTSFSQMSNHWGSPLNLGREKALLECTLGEGTASIERSRRMQAISVIWKMPRWPQ